MSLPCSQEWQPIIVPGIVSCFDEASASSMRVQVSAAWASHLPDAVVGLLPAGLEELDQLAAGSQAGRLEVTPRRRGPRSRGAERLP